MKFLFILIIALLAACQAPKIATPDVSNPGTASPLPLLPSATPTPSAQPTAVPATPTPQPSASGAKTVLRPLSAEQFS